MRDAVDDDGVAGGFGHGDSAEVDEFGGDAFDFEGVDLVYEGAGEGVLHAEEDADFFHACTFLEKNFVVFLYRYVCSIRCHHGQSWPVWSPQTSRRQGMFFERRICAKCSLSPRHMSSSPVARM